MAYTRITDWRTCGLSAQTATHKQTRSVPENLNGTTIVRTAEKRLPLNLPGVPTVP